MVRYLNVDHYNTVVEFQLKYCTKKELKTESAFFQDKTSFIELPPVFEKFLEEDGISKMTSFLCINCEMHSPFFPLHF